MAVRVPSASMSNTRPNASLRAARLLIAVLLATAGTMGCQSTPAPSGPPPAVVTAADAGARVHLSPGQQLLVRLLANPATGFEWELLTFPDQSVLIPDGSRMVESAEQKAGSEEVRTQELRFVAQGPGATRVVLEYLVPGQPNASGNTSFSFDVEVAGP